MLNHDGRAKLYFEGRHLKSPNEEISNVKSPKSRKIKNKA